MMKKWKINDSRWEYVRHGQPDGEPSNNEHWYQNPALMLTARHFCKKSSMLV